MNRGKIKIVKDNKKKRIGYTINGKNVSNIEKLIKEVTEKKHSGYHIKIINGKEFISANPDKNNKWERIYFC